MAFALMGGEPVKVRIVTDKGEAVYDTRGR